VFDLELLPLLCLAPNEMINGECKPPCPPNTTRQPNGTCALNEVAEPPPPPPPPPQPPQLDLQIILPVLCLAPNEMVNGECKPPCAENEVRKPDGTCGPKPLQINPNLLEVLPNLQLQVNP
jgi:hypothetical protein